MSMKFSDIARRIELFIKDLQQNDYEIIYPEKPWPEDKSESDFLYLNAISHLELAKNNLKLSALTAQKEDRQRFEEELEADNDEY